MHSVACDDGSTRALEVSLKTELFVDNLLVRIHFIIVMIRWTDLAPWEFEYPFPGSLTSTFLVSTLNFKSPTPNPEP